MKYPELARGNLTVLTELAFGNSILIAKSLGYNSLAHQWENFIALCPHALDISNSSIYRDVSLVPDRGFC
jgi:hypothetical protein